MLIGFHFISIDMAQRLLIFGICQKRREMFLKFGFRRGRALYLNENRLKFLYSAWISSNLDQIIQRWSTDQLDL